MSLRHYYDKVLDKYYHLNYVDDDIFHVHGYPSDELHSLSDTILFLDKYIADNNLEDDHFKDSIEAINNFWNKYPNGVIRFI